jgi:hypothetical protein
MKRFLLFVVVSLIGFPLNAVWAVPTEILPGSYSFDKATDTGTFTYHDETGVQLIDGSYGVAPWSADLGNGPAYEWLGWLFDSPVNVDFDFGATTQIDSIDVGTVQDNISDVVIPFVEIYDSPDGSTWTLVDSISIPESSANDDTYMTLQFNDLGINDQFVRVALLHSFNGPWTFVDEVDFFQESTPIPEPSTLVLLFAGIVGTALYTYHRKQVR